MNSAVFDTSGAASKHSSGAGGTYAAELNAVHQCLQAEKADLEHLLGPIHEARVSPRQAYALLTGAWLGLQELRESQSEFSGSSARKAGLARLIEQAFSHLRSGEAFSLDASDSAFEQACGRCLETGCAPRLVAGIRAAQARLATTRLDYRRAAERYAQAASVEGLDVPLQWRYQLQRASALEALGREFMDSAALEEAIDLYETGVLALAPREERPDDWAATQQHLGNALATLGQRQRGTWLLEKAIAVFESVLAERSREREPLDWAATQNSLGYALGTLAQRHADSDMLEQSVAALEAALEVRSREETPQDWAITRNNLGAVLLALGQRKKDKTILKQAADAYKDVLQVWTRERAPLDWASCMNNLGTALRALGEHRKGPRTLEQSVAAYRSALSERVRERVPQDWAMTQNNLGAALHKLGEREEDVQHLEAAIEAYDNALREWTRERAPAAWAMTLANQAAARKALAELSGDVDLVRAALSDFAAVGEVFRNASHAQYYELVVEQVALLRKLEQQLLHAGQA
ncbi:MAG: tetratricopeptide repeat protein [Thiogranum sp.]|nr:tetratricopeptide repeat protein [Thiogranum sp.]